jgi:hypothetical protein
MVDKALKAKLKNAFADDDSFLDEYTSALRDNLRDIEARTTQATRTLIILLVAFELLHRAAISEVSAFGFKFSDLSLIQKFLPLVAAYMYYLVSSLYVMRRLTREAHDEAIQLKRPTLVQNGVHYYLVPSSHFVTEEIVENASTGVVKSLVEKLSMPLMAAILFLPIVFSVYSYVVLFWQFGIKDIVLWFSLIVSIPFSLQGLLLYIGVLLLVPD